MTGGMRPIRQAVLAIGSNLGERIARLQGAVSALEDTPEVNIVAILGVYESERGDTLEVSVRFLNAVVLIDTTLTVYTLIEHVQAFEDAFYRDRCQEYSTRRLF